MFKKTAKGHSLESEEFPKSVWEIIETHRYDTVRGISIAGMIVSLLSGVADFLKSGRAIEFAVNTIPVFSVFCCALILSRYDRSARRSGWVLTIFSAFAMIGVRFVSSPQAAGHFLFFPAAALGSVLLVGFRAGLILAFTTLVGLYVVYFVKLYYHPFPDLVSADTPATFIAAFVMTLVMIILAGRLLRDVQTEYEASNRLLSNYLDRYRSLLSLLTNELMTSIANLKEAQRLNDTAGVKNSFKIIQEILATARRIRGESIPKSE